MRRKPCGGLCYQKDNQFEDLDSLLNVPPGVECLPGTVPLVGTSYRVLVKAKRNHGVLALDSEVRNEDRGAFSGMIGAALCMGFDLVLLLHVCALPVCREQWQYSVKFPLFD